jgi:hypothetical protein
VDRRAEVRLEHWMEKKHRASHAAAAHIYHLCWYFQQRKTLKQSLALYFFFLKSVGFGLVTLKVRSVDTE